MIIELLDSGSLTNREMLTNVQNAESANLPLIYTTKFYRNTRFWVKIPETTLIAMRGRNIANKDKCLFILDQILIK